MKKLAAGRYDVQITITQETTVEPGSDQTESDLIDECRVHGDTEDWSVERKPE